MPLYIAKSGDLDRCYRCLTHSLTHSQSKDRATQLLTKYKSGALVTQFHTAAGSDGMDKSHLCVFFHIKSSDSRKCHDMLIPLTMFDCEHAVIK